MCTTFTLLLALSMSLCVCVWYLCAYYKMLQCFHVSTETITDELNLYLQSTYSTYSQICMRTRSIVNTRISNFVIHFVMHSRFADPLCSTRPTDGRTDGRRDRRTDRITTALDSSLTLTVLEALAQSMLTAF